MSVLKPRDWGHLQDGGEPLFLVAVIMTVASTMAVFLRLTFGKEPKLRFSVDDILILIALTINVIMNTLTVLSVYWGFGNPTDTLTPHDSSNALLMFWITQSLYKVVMVFTKLSVLAFLVHCFGRNKIFRGCCWFLMAFVVFYNIASTVATIVQCQPIDRAWNKSIPGTCIDLTASWYSNAVASISSDLAIVILPMRPVCMLQISMKRRISLALVFSVGLIVVLCSILRMTSLGASSTAKDQSTGSMTSTCYTASESSIAIVGACLVFMKRPFEMVIGKAHTVLSTSKVTTQTVQAGSDLSRFSSLRSIPARLSMPTTILEEQTGRTVASSMWTNRTSYRSSFFEDLREDEEERSIMPMNARASSFRNSYGSETYSYQCK